MSQINFKTTGIKSEKAQMIRHNKGQYIVFNGEVNGRRQEIYSTYIKEAAEKELEKRLS